MKKLGNLLHNPIFSVVFLTLVPAMLCILVPVLSGKSFFDVWIPGSGWNDEAFYFKQAEAMARFGTPRGYWGYNESAAVTGGFGAWGPAVLMPFAVFGRIFGWNILSPCIFNLAFLTLSILILALVCKPELIESLLLALVLVSFMPAERFLLSGMAEIMILSGVLWVLALCFSELSEHSLWKQVLMALFITYLIAVRPYFGVLIVLPWLSGFKHRAFSRFLPLVSVGLGFTAYVFIGKYLSAPYFEGIYTDWLGKCFTHGPRTVFNEMLDALVNSFKTMGFMMYDSITGDNYAGAFFIVFLLLSILLLLNCVICAIKAKNAHENTYKALMSGLMFAGQTAVLLAIMLLYNLFDGYRHLFVFIVIDILLLILISPARYFNAGIMAAVFVLFFCIKKPVYPVPYAEAAARAEFASKTVTMEETIKLTDGLTWDNTFLVAGEDLAAASKDDPDYLEVLYVLPEGSAVNYCTQDYILNNRDNLKAGYLITLEGSDCDVIAYFNGLTKEISYKEYNIYRLR